MFLALCLGLSLAAPARAEESPQAKALVAELRCPVCQGQSLAESQAPIARDIRAYIDERLDAGAAPEAVKAELVARYGETVLEAPPITARSLALYTAPLALLLMGAGGICYYFVTRRLTSPTKVVNENEARDA